MLIKKLREGHDIGGRSVWFHQNGLISNNNNKNMRRVSTDDFLSQNTSTGCLIGRSAVDYAPKKK